MSHIPHRMGNDHRRVRCATPARWEQVFFIVAVTVITTHLVDDSFAHPEPGMSASDHPVSGLLPLAVIAMGTLAHRRARAGARATICLTLGIFGVVAAAEGWYHTFQGGASGDDLTGLLTLPAGLALLVLATVVLWASTRRILAPALHPPQPDRSR